MNLDVVFLPIRLALLILVIVFFLGFPIAYQYYSGKPKSFLFRIAMLLSNISMALFILGFIFMYLSGRYGWFQ
jgi:hypothetical protein